MYPHYLAGLIILLIPYILSFISYIEIACVYKTQMVSDIALLAFEVLAMIVLFYSMACTVVMVCGNSMMSIVIYDVANVLLCCCVYDVLFNKIRCSLMQQEKFRLRIYWKTDLYGLVLLYIACRRQE